MPKIPIVKRRHGDKLAPNFTTPFFCPTCEEIRGVDPETEATGLTSPHESLMFESFQMCTACHQLMKEHPEQVEANKQEFKRKLIEKEKLIAEKVGAKRFRVWIDGDFGKYVESITGKPFFNFEVNGNYKCKSLLDEEEARRTVETIMNKNLKAWIEEEEV